MPRSTDRAHDVLASHRLRHERLVDLVAQHARADDVEGVLRSATVTANHAWRAPNGLLTDPRLERLVVGAVRQGDRAEVDGTRTGGRVLHVLSEAYLVGGHTRLARRWIARDHRRADLALTNHAGPVPAPLAAAVTDSGGHVHDLRSDHADLLARAVALRTLMDRADFVVLHVHPYDAVALAAVNLPGPRPPVILENHTDHAFWLGVGAADVISEFRPFGRRLSTELRGVGDRSVVLPIPVDAEHPTAPREDFRRSLGIPATAVVGLTVATEAKLAPLFGRGMDRLLDRALNWCPQLVLLLVGASPDGSLARLARRHPGRVRLLGHVLDAMPYYAAADVYLESYPTRSGTSVLEAAMFGMPVLALTDLPEEDLLHVYQAGSPGLDTVATMQTPEAFVRALRAVVADPELRARRGEEARSAVASVHSGTGWCDALEDLYAHARTSSAAEADDLPEPVVDLRYGAVLLTFSNGADAEEVPLAGVVTVLGELADEGVHADLFAATHRQHGPTLTIRVSEGWETRPDWTTRLLALAGRRRRLAVSLPFASQDDARGSRTAAALTSLLADLGQTPEDCGDIDVAVLPPVGAQPSITGELPLTDDALDWLERVVSSVGWGDRVEPAAVAVGVPG